MLWKAKREILSQFNAPLSPDAIKQYNKSDSHGIYREKDFLFKIHQQISIKIRNHLSGRRNDLS